MAIKPSKCKLFQDNLKFLGHIINSTGIHPTEQNVEVVTNFPRPLTVKHVRSFIGSVGFYRRFISNFTEKAAPLYLLLKKGNGRVQWSAEAEAAFLSLKSSLTTAPLLAYPNFSKPFFISTDASDVGIGGILEQENEEGQLQPVAYCGRKLNKAEFNYAAIEKEALAIVYALQQFKHITYGYEVILRTDHRPLTYVFRLKDSNQRLIRWLLTIQDHRLQFEHVPGKLNVFADWLSRRPVSIEGKDIAAIGSVREPLSITRIVVAQILDPDIKSVKDQIEAGKFLDREYIIDSDNLVLKRVKHYRGWGSMYRVLVPYALIQEVICNYHDTLTSGHLSLSKTLWKVRNNFTWDTMQRDTATYINSCDICQRRSVPRKRAPLQPVTPAIGCMQRLSMDLMGPFHTTARGNKYIILWTDNLSRYTIGSPIKNMEATTISHDYLYNVFARFGGSREIVTDRGGQMTGKIFQSLCQKLKVKHIMSSPYHPSGNGLAERANAKIISILAKICNANFSDWDVMLPFALHSINTSVHRSTGESPFYIMHGFDPIDPASDVCLPKDKDIDDIHSYIQELSGRMELARVEVGKNLEDSSIKSCQSKAKNMKLNEFQIGQLVLVLDPTSYTGHNRKFKPRFKGPYRIIEKTSIVNYRVRNVVNPSDIKSLHIDRLKPYIVRKVVNDTVVTKPKVNKTPTDTLCTVHNEFEIGCEECEDNVNTGCVPVDNETVSNDIHNEPIVEEVPNRLPVYWFRSSKPIIQI